MRQNILIVEDDLATLWALAEGLTDKDTGFEHVPPATKESFATADFVILKRGEDQIHITRFKDTALQAMTDYSYIAGFFDFLVRQKDNSQVPLDVEILDFLESQPQACAYLISGGIKGSKKISYLKEWTAGKRPKIDIDQLVQTDKLKMSAKDTYLIKKHILELLSLRTARVEPHASFELE